MILGALEAGGTKMVCAVGKEDGTILCTETFPTLTPEETLPQLIRFFAGKNVESVGIGSFGPVDLDLASPTYGSITTTPKLAWQHTPIASRFRDALGVPVGFDTDVNGAAYGEALLGAGRGCSSLLYVTVGTGIGGGVILEGKPMHGMLHCELGHILLRPEADDPSPDGFCPFHKGCLEGLASGPALEKRWGRPGRDLGPDHPAWDLEARYLAQMCADVIVTLSPQKIILGGGVMHQDQLFPLIRRYTKEYLNGYIQTPEVTGGMEDYIVSPGLGDRAGITGALLLAKDALK